MTRYVARADDTVPVAAGSRDLAFDRSFGSLIEWGRDFFVGWAPTEEGESLLCLAMAAYSIDKLTSRSGAPDAWTRRIHLATPSRGSALDGKAIASALSFLSGDEWEIAPYRTVGAILHDLPARNALIGHLAVDAVTLFSGGLDSLCGAIDYLEANPDSRLALVAHYEGGQASPRQVEIAQRLAQEYGADRVVLRRLWVRPAPRELGGKFDVVETTTRARSLLFISAALSLASSVGAHVPVIVPENGYIALNVPLTGARVGSYSTRTTHPHYLQLLHEAAVGSGVTNPIQNPYVLMTKGEMLRASRNQGLLRDLAPRTISCSHPEVGRWGSREQGNCGYCFPCIIRQSSMHFAGFPRDVYGWDVLTEAELIDEVAQNRGADLRAVINGVFADRQDREVLRNGPLPGNRKAHLDVWRRGNESIRTWLTVGAQGRLKEIIDGLDN